MRPQEFSYTPGAANLTGFLSNATGATWTLTATTAGDGLAHQVTIRNDSVTDHSAKTAVLVGTDADGQAITETMSLPGTSATTTSTKYFKTLTSITPSATIGADTMDIGWAQTSLGPTVPVDVYSPMGTLIAVDITGTINYSIEETNDKVWDTTNLISNAGYWFVISGLSGKTADAVSSCTAMTTAWRLKITSVTAGATVTINTTQSNW